MTSFAACIDACARTLLSIQIVPVCACLRIGLGRRTLIEHTMRTLPKYLPRALTHSLQSFARAAAVVRTACCVMFSSVTSLLRHCKSEPGASRHGCRVRTCSAHICSGEGASQVITALGCFDSVAMPEQILPGDQAVNVFRRNKKLRQYWKVLQASIH